jgi:hypothetical protein
MRAITGVGILTVLTRFLGFFFDFRFRLLCDDGDE